MTVAVVVGLALLLAGCVGTANRAASDQGGVVTLGEVDRTVSAAGALSGVNPNGAGGVAVVAFPESGAAAIKAHQPVTLTCDALPGLSLSGQVLAVAPNAVTISGVTNFYVTVVLTGSDPRLRAGMTVQATVVVAQRHNVLVVPNAAVRSHGGQAFVRVPGADGAPTSVAFTPGLVGDQTTEVLGGLREGQRVLLPAS